MRQVREGDRPFGPGSGAADLPGAAWNSAGAVKPDHYIRIEDRDKTFEIAASQSGKERFDELALFWERGVRRPVRYLHSATRPASQLPRRRCEVSSNGSDFVEGHREHVVQHKRDALGRSQPVEHNEQCEADRIGQQNFLLGIAAGFPRRAGSYVSA
jgi:hypothetical protein